MNCGKNYTVKQYLTKDDESEIERILRQHPLWKRKDARALIARRKHAKAITGLKAKEECTHIAPKRGEITTQCCGKPLWELKHEDGHRLTHKPENCTCLPRGYAVGQWENKSTGKRSEILTR